MFNPVHWQGFFYAPYSGSIVFGGPSNAKATSSYSGAFLKWDMTGRLDKFAGGWRSPNGCGISTKGDMMVTDNQGSWLPSSTINHVKQGRFYGHRQTGFPPNWAESLPYDPPLAWLDHGTVRSSPGAPIYVDKGRYAGDWILGDTNGPGLQRISIDEVGGRQQGCIFWFSKGTGNDTATWSDFTFTFFKNVLDRDN